ncbi:MAG: hypothetical protein GY811_00025 [Myxococcales bacterium]|nr:hypothetical protein [Myxococcales bacterium]
MRGRGASLIAALSMCGAAAGSGSAAADSDDPSAASGRFGFTIVGRYNRGDLGELYRAGFLWGVHAGLDKPVGDSQWTVRLRWTALVRGYYFASDDSQVESTIDLTEVDLAVSASHTFLRPGQRLFGNAGAVLLLSKLPIPPTDDRRYLGWFAGLGFERTALGEWAWSVEARYSRLDTGLANLNLVGGMTAGF